MDPRREEPAVILGRIGVSASKNKIGEWPRVIWRIKKEANKSGLK